MGFSEREQFKCPCYSKTEDFQQLLDLKDNGLAIYCYTDCNANVDTAGSNTSKPVVILQNTTNINILSAELMPKLESSKITCPRCKKILRDAKELLNKVPGIDKSDIVTICDHCRLKAQAKESCNTCKKTVLKFWSTIGRKKGDSVFFLQSLTHSSPTQYVLQEPQKSIKIINSEIKLPKLKRARSASKLKTQPMFSTGKYISDPNLNMRRVQTETKLEKEVQFTEVYKESEITPMASGASDLTNPYLDENIFQSRRVSLQVRNDVNIKKLLKQNRLIEEEKIIDRRIAKRRREKEELDLAIKTKEEKIAKFRNILKSRRCYSDNDLQKDFSFFFPQESQMSLQTPASHVRSSEIIQFIREKLGITTEEQIIVKQSENKTRLEIQPKNSFIHDENKRQTEEKQEEAEDETIINKKEKSNAEEGDQDQSQVDKNIKEMEDVKKQVDGEAIKEQKLITEISKTQKNTDNTSTVNKPYAVIKTEQKNKESEKATTNKQAREGKKEISAEGLYMQEKKKLSDEKNTQEKQSKAIDYQKSLAGKKTKIPIDDESKQMESKEKPLKDKYSKQEQIVSTLEKKQPSSKITASEKTAIFKAESKNKDESNAEHKQNKAIDYQKTISRKKTKEPIDKEIKQMENKKSPLEDRKKHKFTKEEQIVSTLDKRQASTKNTGNEKTAILKVESKDKEIQKHKITAKSPENLKIKTKASQPVADLEPITRLGKGQHKERRNHLEERTIEPKSKDIKEGRIEKLVSVHDKTRAITAEKTEPVLKSAQIEKDSKKQLERSKKIEQSQGDLHKLFGAPKHLADVHLTHEAEKKIIEQNKKDTNLDDGVILGKFKDTTLKKKTLLPPGKNADRVIRQLTPEKNDPITKPESRMREKEKVTRNLKKEINSKENLTKIVDWKKDVTDTGNKHQSEKQYISEEKKSQRVEQAIQTKVKEVLSKQNKMVPPETQLVKNTRQFKSEKIDSVPKIKEKGQEIQNLSRKNQAVEVTAIKKLNPSQDGFVQFTVGLKTKGADDKDGRDKPKKDDQLNKVKNDDLIKLKPLREAKVVVKSEPKQEKTKSIKMISRSELMVNISKIKLRNPSIDNVLLNLIRIKQGQPRHRTTHEPPPPVDLLMRKLHEDYALKRGKSNIICNSSDLQLEFDIYTNRMVEQTDVKNIIIGENLIKYRPQFSPLHFNQLELVPMFFKSKYSEESASLPSEKHLEVLEESDKVDPESKKGIIRYALSDRSFIEKGWTLLPTEKVVRKMNVYRMRPAHPEFDWFEHNKHKRFIQYDTCEKFAEFDDNGRGRWYYKNGRLALDYYDAEETNAQQRFVVYSSGEPDERGRSHPITVLATFDYLGNGIVLDHAGKIRLKYNQTEGVVLDRSIGPVSHWKWHTLNDPPVLQQVMIDTQMSHKDPNILKLGGAADNKTRPDNEEMLAIEFDNFVKDKNKKLSQKFKPFQIKMKALKINEHFSLRVLDQATIYLIFRDGSTNLKLNIGMVLDHHEIVDTDTAEVGEVSNNLERLPARTDSLAGMQRSIAFAQRYERNRTERERRLRPSEPCASADNLVAAASRPLRPPLRTVTLAPTGSTSNPEFCKCSRRPSSNLYYNTRLT